MENFVLNVIFRMRSIEENCRYISISVTDWLQLGKIGCRVTIYEATELAQAKIGNEGIRRGKETRCRDISVEELIGVGNWLVAEVERDNRVKDASISSLGHWEDDHPSTKRRKIGGRVGLEGKRMHIFLDMLHIRCLGDIQVDFPIRHLGMRV